MHPESFPALVVRENAEGIYTRKLERRNITDLPPGEVLVRVDFSSLNYKDALSAAGNRGVTKKYPHTPGIDAAGAVVESGSALFRPGDEVIVSGYDLGMNTSGGFGRYVRVPADWVMPRPRNLTLQKCMQIGTAGFTAAQCVSALRTGGVRPAAGPVLVTGASGGVGCIAIALLKQSGFTVVAATGKAAEHPWLREMGADDFLGREQVDIGSNRMLLRERWAGVVDTVGGNILAAAIKSIKYDGIAACCGNAASGDLPLNVYPFILRGVKLVGIDSARCPMERRKDIWGNFGDEWNMQFLDRMSVTVGLAGLGTEIEQMLAGQVKGRIVVDLREAI